MPTERPTCEQWHTTKATPTTLISQVMQWRRQGQWGLGVDQGLVQNLRLLNEVKKTITVPSDFTVSEGMGEFNIKVTIPQEGEEATGLGGQAVRIWGTTKGNAPQMFMLEGTWRWPKEKQNIEDAYPNFAKWNSNHQNVDWVNSPVDGLVWE